MFWLNGSMVNPFGGTIFDKKPASAAEYVKALEECYEGFAMDTSAMHLYAFSRTNQQAEFEIGIESMTEEYDAVKGGWFATDKAASEVIETACIIPRSRERTACRERDLSTAAVLI